MAVSFRKAVFAGKAVFASKAVFAPKAVSAGKPAVLGTAASDGARSGVPLSYRRRRSDGVVPRRSTLKSASPRCERGRRGRPVSGDRPVGSLGWSLGAALALLLIAAVTAPEGAADQAAICQRHNGVDACRVW
jgi:hypothetical protein